MSIGKGKFKRDNTKNFIFDAIFRHKWGVMLKPEMDAFQLVVGKTVMFISTESIDAIGIPHWLDGVAASWLKLAQSLGATDFESCERLMTGLHKINMSRNGTNLQVEVVKVEESRIVMP